MESGFPKGIWIYRSFYNVTDPVDGHFDQLELAEGEMVFEVALAGDVRGQLAFRSSPPDPGDPRLMLTGAVQSGTPNMVRFQGVGVAGTGAEGWVYDYTGYLVPNWPNGNGQVAAIVGSLIRTVPHPGSDGTIRQAGFVASFIALELPFPEPRQVIPLPDEVKGMLASREHRLHHAVWHGVRNSWSGLDDPQRKEIASLGWESPRASVDAVGTPIINNGAGEDFLFMHREMIIELNSMLEEMKEKPIQGWSTIPAPGPIAPEPDYTIKPPTLPTRGNPDGFSVPPTWINPDDEVTNRRIAALKTDEYYWSRMQWWDRKFKNPEYLSTLTLGQLGSLLEYSVHNDMHMRWASVPRDPDTGEPIPGGRPDPDISKKWDNPKYDFLGEFYSSHVNPVFWRLHSWIDNRITDWFQAHEALHLGEIEQYMIRNVPWFKPGKWVLSEDPWVGPREEHKHHHGMPHFDINKMQLVMAILFGPSPTDRSFALRSAPLRRQSKRLTWF